MKYGMLLMPLLLVSVAGAELETVEMGPYEVSFDMGDIEYELWDISMEEGETYDGTGRITYRLILVTPSDDLIAVGVSCFSQPSEIRFYKYQDAIPYGDNLYGAEAYIRMVDDKQVVMLVGDGYDTTYGNTEFYTGYILESDGWIDPDGEFSADVCADRNAYLSGTTFVDIFSNADWSTTHQLLNTVHVERISE